ncbi:MAG: HigA family addiction module antitoxin [Planctomycetota bacterium]|nr:HigA family addiction module antitoxin [Planctomycetota bacterium]
MNERLPKNPTHPGEMLLEEFLNPLGISQVEFARHIGVSFKRINEIVNGRRAVTPETAWLFAAALGTSPQFWMNLQATYDLVHHRVHHAIKPLRTAV